MAEEGLGLRSDCTPPVLLESGASYSHEETSKFNLAEDVKVFLEDETFTQLRRHFMMQGKGRRPDLPQVDGVTNKLLLQLFLLKEEMSVSYRQMTTWLHKLLPSTQTVSEGRIKHRVNIILDHMKALDTDKTTDMLCKDHIFDNCTLPQPLVSLGIHLDNLCDPEKYDKAPQDDISNHAVVCLSQIMTRENKSPIFLRRWLVKLSSACSALSEKKLKISIENLLKTYKKLTKNKKGNNLDQFLQENFVKKESTAVSVPHPNVCKRCQENEKLDSLIKQLENEVSFLKSCKENLESEIRTKDEVIKEIQVDKDKLMCQFKELKAFTAEEMSYKKHIKQLETKLEEISDTKLYYRRNKELNKANEELRNKVNALESSLEKEQKVNVELKKKVKSEQDLKSKYKIVSETLNEEKSTLLSLVNSENTEKEISFKQKEGKCMLYSDNVRLLYMALQGEANVVATQASKVVKLVAKYLFNKEFHLKDLPCPRTCLNFMDEAHHIAKQHVVSEINNAKHFTYATDGTSRQKRHYMEHHLVLDNGSTLSVGFTEVADDKADTLLEKSLELFDELSDVYCQAEEADPDETLKMILSKLKSLMSDRAANMKLFNKKMLEYKQDLLGGDTTIQFLYCNAHFLIGLADETEKAVKFQEAGIENESGRKLGRDAQPAFMTWSSSETSAFRLLRTAADALGPRGDEKNGCREEWLAYCDRFELKSQFTSFRSNRFNNIFENAIALLFHFKEIPHFLNDCASHMNKKLQSICFDLQDKNIVSIITAIALLATYLTSPYWALMNSNTPYGKFPAFVQNMKTALERWSSDAFDLSNLHDEQPIFGSEFTSRSDTANLFLNSDFCNKSLVSEVFKNICQRCRVVMERQLADFLSEGIYGSVIPKDIQDLLNTCPLTNLTGERLFGDLDFDISKRRIASTHLRSTVNMWKHNTPSKFLDQKNPSALKISMASGRKHGKILKEKNKAAVQMVNKKIKEKIIENERKKKEKEIQDKERHASLLNDIMHQGGLCQTKEDLDNLLSQPQPLQNLKSQMRFRKHYMGAKDLRLTGNFRMLYHSLCCHLGFESDIDSTQEPPSKRRKIDISGNESPSESSDLDLNQDEEESESESDSEC